MKTFAIVLLLAAMAVPATAAVIHNEGSQGDLSSSEAAPTPLVFAIGGNTIIGSVNGLPLDRDYITFTVPSGQAITAINLIAFSPNNLAFSSLNSGATSFVPSGATIGAFLAGIHIDVNDIGDNLLTYYDTRSVTTNSLPSPSLGPGTYSWLIQQTSAVLQSYTVEFVLEGTIATESSTWGKVKALYR
jgi:hypothetical protein